MATFPGWITIVTEGLGVSFENIVLIVVLLGSIIFYSQDFKIGAIISFLLTGAVFTMAFSLFEAGYPVNYTYSLAAWLMCLVILALALFQAGANQKGGGSFV